MKLTVREKWIAEKTYWAGFDNNPCPDFDSWISGTPAYSECITIEEQLAHDAPVDWISVKSRLPEDGALVLGYGKHCDLNTLAFNFYMRPYGPAWITADACEELTGVEVWQPMPVVNA